MQKRSIFYEKDVKVFIQHIVESIKTIETYTQGISKEDFVKNLQKIF